MPRGGEAPPALEATLAIAPHHPACEGHFPGHPIVPAVVLLAEALAAIEAATLRPSHGWTIASAKFLAAVGPGTVLTLAHEPTTSGGRRFEIRGPGGIVASGSLDPA